ncbi:MAG: metallophosphoesterase [Hyphomonas sp.]|nr:metallophosphoesterase [Hyphomonas sp.]
MTMHIAILTDIHLTVEKNVRQDIDPKRRLVEALDFISGLPISLDLIVVMGDLAESAEPQAYEWLLELVSKVDCPVRLLIGNHDDRDVFKSLCSPELIDRDGFVQSSVETDREMFLFLDTVRTGETGGSYCSKRQAWLSEQLHRSKGKAAYLFMHHPPFDVGTHHDASKIKEHGDFAAIVREYGTVSHILVGHIHRTASGRWCNASWSSLGGTHVQSNLTFPGVRKAYRTGSGYVGILMIEGPTSIFHYSDFVNNY